MPNAITEHWRPKNPKNLGMQFRLLGWVGFWIQAALVVVPVLLAFYVVFLRGPESDRYSGIELGNYLSFGGLLVMIFTTLWFYRYTRLAGRIADPELCPSQRYLMRTLWIGLWAGCAGIFFSMILMAGSVWRMLLVLLATPQTGIPITAPMGDDPATTISAIDALSMTSLLAALAAELIVLVFSLWLLFRVTRPSANSAESAESMVHEEDLIADAQ